MNKNTCLFSQLVFESSSLLKGKCNRPVRGDMRTAKGCLPDRLAIGGDSSNG